MGKSSDYLERATSIAVYGGTFDPIHNGHLAIAEAVLHQFMPQRVLFVPAGDPPHKPDRPITSSEHRYQMVLRSISRTPGFDISRFEIDRHGPSYTISTIKALREICPEDCIIYLVIGQDALQDIDSWKDIDELASLCQFITVPRPGYNPELLKQLANKMKKKYNTSAHILRGQKIDISSTFVRKRFNIGDPVSMLVPREVEEYARKYGLYSTIKPNLSDSHFEWVKSSLETRLTPKRFKHTLGVIIEAEKLANHYGADVHKARWAALLHDCTKEYGAEKKRMLCKQWNIKIDEIIEAHIDLAHGLLGAESALRHFYVTDNEILQAIRFHISGHKDLTLLDKIIVLADFIEPYRDDYYPLEKMRELAYVNIDKALVYGLVAMRDMDAARGKTIHYWSQDAIEALGGTKI